jgi:hypothetical protein
MFGKLIDRMIEIGKNYWRLAASARGNVSLLNRLTMRTWVRARLCRTRSFCASLWHFWLSARNSFLEDADINAVLGYAMLCYDVMMR